MFPVGWRIVSFCPFSELFPLQLIDCGQSLSSRTRLVNIGAYCPCCSMRCPWDEGFLGLKQLWGLGWWCSEGRWCWSLCLPFLCCTVQSLFLRMGLLVFGLLPCLFLCLIWHSFILFPRSWFGVGSIAVWRLGLVFFVSRFLGCCFVVLAHCCF